MVFQSLLPPVPDLPFPNAHHFFLNRPDQAKWEDYVLHVDALTGKTRKWSEFKDKVKRGATAFGDPSLFPHEDNEIVGILSENCIVSFLSLILGLCADGRVPWARMCRSTWRSFIHCWLLASRSPYFRRRRLHTS